MKKVIPAAMRRVITTQNTAQDAAAQIRVDYTGGGDLAYLTVNPDVAGPEALPGYQVRAAIQAALEPLRRYNRAMTRRHGTYKPEQKLFDDAMAKVAEEIEQLVHLTPTVDALPDLATVATAPREPADAALPDDFPEVEGLREIGIRTYQAVRDATDDQLREAKGVGPRRLDAVREATTAYYTPAAADAAAE